MSNTAAAAWINDPGFKYQDNPVNIHTLFRKSFDIKTPGLVRATMYFTADDFAKLYVNGDFLQCAPAPGYQHYYYYQVINLLPYLNNGNNCLAVHNYYQGLINRVWNSGDLLCGIFARLELEYDDGGTETIVTDSSWRCLPCHAYDSERKFGYDTQFAEDIDMRIMPLNWQQPGYNDTAWIQAAIAVNYPHQLVRQETPPLTWRKVFPHEVKTLAPGCYLLDFGREVVGSAIIKTHGDEGAVIEIRHAEELDENGMARFSMRANCIYQEYATLSGRETDVIEFFDYKAFRYLELLNLSREPAAGDIYVYERCHPFPENGSAFASANHELELIWDICRRAVRLGTQDSYLDCMSREKGAYLGDAFVTGQSHLYLTGKTAMLKKVLADFASSARFCPGIKAVAPGAFMQDIADYSLLWPALLYEYYQWSGDADFVESTLSVLGGMLQFFAPFENAAGLLTDFTAMPILVDWPSNLRDDYDDPHLMGTPMEHQTGNNTVLNLYYYGALTAALKLYAIAGRKRAVITLEERRQKLQRGIMTQLFRDGLFRDTEISSHASLHANALALAVGVIPDHVDKTTIFRLVKDKRLSCGVYFAFFVLQGLFNYRQTDIAYELLTSEDKQSWITMVRSGATTCMEAWGPDQKWNTSWCHPWASAPVFILAAEIFGLKPGVPGWSELQFRPQVPAALPHAGITVSIPQGRIDAGFEQDADEIRFSLRLPSGVRANFSMPETGKRIIINGTQLNKGFSGIVA